MDGVSSASRSSSYSASNSAVAARSIRSLIICGILAAGANEIASCRKQWHASVPGTVRSIGRLGRIEALAEIITASALLIEPDVPGGDREILLTFLPQTRDEIREETGEQLTYERP